MKFRTITMAVAAAGLAVAPVAAQAGTSASSVATVGERASARTSDANELGARGPVLLYLLGAITLATLIALLAGGGKKCQSRGVTVPCS